MTDTKDLTPYQALKDAQEYWVVGGFGSFVFRFGPFKAVEMGPIIEKALADKVGVTIIAQCGREIDWEMLKDAQGDKITSSLLEAAEPKSDTNRRPEP
ncbi:MAG: hypothetical protein ACPGGK_13010 [Pikeienuella sp.]